MSDQNSTRRPLELGAWRASPVTKRQIVDPAPVRALAALIDSGLDVPGPGDPLPPLWHWCALPRWAAASTTGEDGHPPRGGFLPPIDLPRRMFAGGEVTVVSPLVVGETVDRVDEVSSVEEKSGSSGPLVVVGVESTLRGADGTLRLRERQELVFRDAPDGAAPADLDPTTTARMASVGPPLGPGGEGPTWAVRTDPMLLMRFSAASANLHRIHYDWPFATQVEGYPGLVVQGPLMSVLLAETLRLADVDAGLTRLSGPLRLRHRNRAPLFCHDPAAIGHECIDDAVVATLARDPAGLGATTCATLAVAPAADDEKETSHA